MLENCQNKNNFQTAYFTIYTHLETLSHCTLHFSKQSVHACAIRSTLVIKATQLVCNVFKIARYILDISHVRTHAYPCAYTYMHQLYLSVLCIIMLADALTILVIEKLNHFLCQNVFFPFFKHMYCLHKINFSMFFPFNPPYHYQNFYVD